MEYTREQFIKDLQKRNTELVEKNRKLKNENEEMWLLLAKKPDKVKVQNTNISNISSLSIEGADKVLSRFNKVIKSGGAK